MVKKNRYGKSKDNQFLVAIFSILSTSLIPFLAMFVIGEKSYDFIFELFAIIISIIGIWLVVYQLREARKIQSSDFIMSLNQIFVENQDYKKVYTYLEENVQNREDQDIKLLEAIEVSNYLTFFESIYLMIEKGTITMKELDDLFSYRFFLAVHNEYIQKIKLTNVPYNFRNIYYLEQEWIDYKTMNNLPVFKSEYNLKKVLVDSNKEATYNSIMNFKKEKGRN